jgi:cytochrome c biogenesis protein CcdA
MKCLRCIAWFSLILFLATANLATLASSNHRVVVYLNGSCPVCTRYVEELESALNSAGMTSVVKYDYSADDDALSGRSDLRESFDVPAEFFGSVTIVVDGQYVFEGYFPADAIVDFVSSNPGFEKLIAAQGLSPDTYRLRRDDLTLECNSSQRIVNCVSSGTFIGVLGTWALVLVSGFVNGLNPCGLLVLACFVGVVSIHQSRRGILKLGAFYVLSIFIVNLGIGLGLLRLALLSGYVEVISKVSGVFLLSLAMLGFKSAFQRARPSPVRIPKRLISPIAKTFSHSWINRSAMGAALLFGGIVAVLEFPCTSGGYAAMIAVLSLRRMESVMYFLGYNLMSIMPLIILLGLSYSIESAPSLKESIERRKHLLRTVSALLLLGLGTFLLLR